MKTDRALLRKGARLRRLVESPTMAQYPVRIEFYQRIESEFSWNLHSRRSKWLEVSEVLHRLRKSLHFAEGV